MHNPPESSICKIVFDILKPHEPPLIDFTTELASINGVRRVNAVVVEVDADTETVKLTVEGVGIKYDKLEESIKNMGAAIHSVDEVMVENPQTQAKK